MTRFVLFWAALLLAALAVGSTQAVALATMSHDREVWNTARIDALPPELGSRVMRPERACGAPVSAAKLFALHLRASGTRFIALHFNDFRCENRNALCWEASASTKHTCARDRGRRPLAVRRGTFRLPIRQASQTRARPVPMPRSFTPEGSFNMMTRLSIFSCKYYM